MTCLDGHEISLNTGRLQKNYSKWNSHNRLTVGEI